MSTPRVSVVIPTHNGARFIREAVASCQAQTLGDWELIVVDDGSKDQTVAIVRALMQSDRRIRLVEHGTNRYLPTALNTGFAQARGAFWTWIADDNLFRPRAFEVMSNYLERHPEVGLVYAAATIIDEAGQPLRLRPAAPPDSLYERNPVGWCFMYPATVRGRIGDYDPDTFLAEDYDYWLRIAIHYRVEALDEDLYLYRAHPGSLTEMRKQDCQRAMAHVKAAWLGRLPWVRRADRALVFFELGSFFARDHKPWLACSCYGRSLLQDPRVAARRLLRRAHSAA